MKTISIGGMGGFEIGIGAALGETAEGNTVRPMAFCEGGTARKAASEILRYHWGGAITYKSPWDIVNSTGYERRSIDIICGKFHHREAPVARAASRVEPKPGGFHAYARLMRALQPRWGLVEFDSGILRADRGRCFQAVLALLTGYVSTIPGDQWPSFGLATPAPGLGDDAFGVSWRVLDLRYFAGPVSPRMERVRCYVVLFRGAACPPKALLDEEDVGGILGAEPQSRYAGLDEDCPVLAFDGRSGGLREEGGFNASPIAPRELLPTIHGQNVALAIPSEKLIRWLDSEECELAFTLPSGYTAKGRRINAKGNKEVAIADSPRYKLLGQHTVPPAIVEWIFGRMMHYGEV